MRKANVTYYNRVMNCWWTLDQFYDTSDEQILVWLYPLLHRTGYITWQSSEHLLYLYFPISTPRRLFVLQHSEVVF